MAFDFEPLTRMLSQLGPAPRFADWTSTLAPEVLRFISSGFFVEKIEHELRERPAESLFQMGLANDSTLKLLASPYAELNVLAINQRAPSTPTLNGFGAHQLVAISHGTVTVDLYAHPQPVDPSLLDRRAVLELVETRTLGAGEFVAAEAGREIIDVREGHGIGFRLSSSRVHAIRWAYDRVTLAPIAQLAADAFTGRVFEAMEMLRRIGVPEDAKLCEQFLDDPLHALRWHALRTALSLGHPDAVAMLQRATADPHPHNRQMAIRVLGDLGLRPPEESA